MVGKEQTDFPVGSAPKLGDEFVVDADVHVRYSDDVKRKVARYMDKPYSNFVDPDVSKSPYPSHGWPKSLGGERKFNIMDVTSPDDLRTHLCEGFGVDVPIINIFSPLDKTLKTDRAIEEMRGINQYMLDQFLDEADDIKGLASIAARSPQAAAKEIDRVGDEEGIVGVYFTVCEEFNQPMGDPSYDVMYRALEDNDLTPVFHVTGIHRDAPVLRKLEKVASWHATGPKWSAEQTLTSLIFQGVPEKFPDLDFVILEGGLGGWIPGMMARLNREYAQWRSELPMLERSPEEYIRESVYFGTQPIDEFNDPEHMKHIIDIVGSESIMFTTDFPHYDFDHPASLDGFLRHLSEDEQSRILHGNAQDVFDLA